MKADEPMSVAKYGYALHVSNQLLDGSTEATRRVLAWMHATPAERAEAAEKAKQARQAERDKVAVVPFTAEALLNRMGWSREYAEHLVQPYCECGDDIDGWAHCQHARDLGLAP